MYKSPDFYKPSDIQKTHLDIRKTDIYETSEYEAEIDEIKLEEYISHGFQPIYESCTDKISAQSGNGADLIYGMDYINSKACYFVIVDDPGASGYDCCGVYIVYYSFNKYIFLDHHAYDKDDRFNLMNLITLF